MIGDRTLTDIVFGNRNGMLTIRPAPLTKRGEPLAVKLVRSTALLCAKSWFVCLLWPSLCTPGSRCQSYSNRQAQRQPLVAADVTLVTRLGLGCDPWLTL